MRPENKKMVEFLKANSIDATAKYQRDGSMRGTWILHNVNIKWSDELRDKLTSLGFTDYSGRPIDRFAGNGGIFCVYVRGHNEFVEQAEAEAAQRLNAVVVPGKSLRGDIKERADCTVRATATVLGIPYAEAHAKLKALGRKNRRGFNLFSPQCQKALGLKMRHPGGVTVGAMLPELQQGRFIVYVSHHVFAVVDGKVFDHSVPNERKRIVSVYEVKS